MNVIDGRKIAADVRLRQWMQVIQARQESGQTVKRFCENNGINEKTYHYWKRKLRETACQDLAVQESQEIVEITAFAESGESERHSGGITIRLANAEVEIQGNASPEVVESVLRALKC